MLRMLQEQPHYENAPIREAVIDIQVVPAPGIAVDDLKKIDVGRSYSQSDAIHTGVGQIQFGPSPGATATASSQPSGFVYKSSDMKQILQAQIGKFTLSRLAPYESWEPFSAEAKRLWTSYRRVAKPLTVNRMGVRYINRIDIPLPLLDFKEYLRTVPEVASDLPQGLAGYLMRLAIPLEDITGMAAITETMVPPPTPHLVSILLDIDVSVSGAFASDSVLIWETFEKLRQKKNLIFNACLTDKAKGLFQ